MQVCCRGILLIGNALLNGGILSGFCLSYMGVVENSLHKLFRISLRFFLPIFFLKLSVASGHVGYTSNNCVNWSSQCVLHPGEHVCSNWYVVSGKDGQSLNTLGERLHEVIMQVCCRGILLIGNALLNGGILSGFCLSYMGVVENSLHKLFRIFLHLFLKLSLATKSIFWCKQRSAAHKSYACYKYECQNIHFVHLCFTASSLCSTLSVIFAVCLQLCFPLGQFSECHLNYVCEV